ncbi:hypothetical protein [Wielerella bovis]|uniref:hypothetical protein n=1 Tax=Wielerella bovis TaxID=2917790 RepID=UPI0020189C6E|nr:hypothetical protein [Wielerella bovis]MCG7657158.1 hypothetical protein [Wielerella bovis]MCG7659381.1 hypothetical protein [Wielerella bovis]
MYISPVMKLVQFAEENRAANIDIKVLSGNSLICFDIYDHSGRPSEWVDLLNKYQESGKFTHAQADKWIFEANQAIEQYHAQCSVN